MTWGCVYLHVDLVVSTKHEVARDCSSDGRSGSASELPQEVSEQLVEGGEYCKVPGMLVGGTQYELDLLLETAAGGEERSESWREID